MEIGQKKKDIREFQSAVNRHVIYCIGKMSIPVKRLKNSDRNRATQMLVTDLFLSYYHIITVNAVQPNTTPTEPQWSIGKSQIHYGQKSSVDKGTG